MQRLDELLVVEDGVAVDDYYYLKCRRNIFM